MKRCANLKSLSIMVLIVALFVLFIPNATKATYSIEELKQKYPTGMQWNDNYHGSTQCHGFAGLIYDSYYGINPFLYAEKITDVSQVGAGDLVRYNGHTVFVLSRSGESVTVAECNYDWQNHVRWDWPKTMAEFRNGFEYILKAPYVLGTTPSRPGKPSHVTVDTSSGVKVSWGKVSNCYGYKIEVYKASGGKVKEIEIKKATTTSTNIFSLETGSYEIRVYAIGVNGMTSDYSSASFSCEKEADECRISPEKKVLQVGDSFTYQVTLNGVAETKFYAGKDTDENIVKIESDGTITALKEGTTQVYFTYKTSRTTSSHSYEVKVITPLKLKETEKKVTIGETSKIAVATQSTEANIQWHSGSSKIATVDQSGKVTGVAPGIAKITAQQTVYNSDKSDYEITIDTCYVTVASPFMKGDVDKNGTISLYDALQILRQAILGGNLTEEKKSIMDYNEDGKVTLYDALKVLQKSILGG